uniref:Citrate synthase n=1 Tax=Paecilomyces fulvus TaxID=89137 RepID=A0A172WCW4_9EURO|nr:citrate synthase-like protein [Paecilomyces fulvus]
MSSGTLFVKDSRTSLNYEIPIHRNAIAATAFKKIKAPVSGSDPADKVDGGLRVHDPGLQNTTVVETDISFSNSDSGLLLFRGYSLDQLWDSDFEELFHLLVWGKYPTRVQKDDLSNTLANYMKNVPENVVKAIRSFPRSTSPMPMVIAGLAAYIASDPESIPAANGGNIYQGNTAQTDLGILKTVSAYAVVLGLVASHRKDIPFVPASSENSYYENLFIMMGMVDRVSGRPDTLQLSCFRRFAALSCDNGMALSVFATLVCASSLADPISCLISALAAAYGPLHFGATEAAHRALQEIGSVERVPDFLEQVKRGERKLFGYGHRTYKGTDPRVIPIKKLLEDSNATSNPLIEIAKSIEIHASTDDYFKSRGLSANADFYGNFVFSAIGFDPDFIPVAMLAQRIIGIMAHWREYMLKRGKLFRPSHIYTGNTEPLCNFSPKL